MTIINYPQINVNCRQIIEKLSSIFCQIIVNLLNYCQTIVKLLSLLTLLSNYCHYYVQMTIIHANDDNCASWISAIIVKILSKYRTLLFLFCLLFNNTFYITFQERGKNQRYEVKITAIVLRCVDVNHANTLLFKKKRCKPVG